MSHKVSLYQKILAQLPRAILYSYCFAVYATFLYANITIIQYQSSLGILSYMAQNIPNSHYLSQSHVQDLMIIEDDSRIIFVIFFHVVAIFWAASLIQATRTTPGFVSKEWNMSVEEKQNEIIKNKVKLYDMRFGLKNLEDIEGGEILFEKKKEHKYDINEKFEKLFSEKTYRFCFKCHSYKPERAHHCAQCNKCILKMDHHCPWIDKCVGLYNYKYFVLFIFNTVILLTIFLWTVFEYISMIFEDGSILFVEAFVFYSIYLAVIVVWCLLTFYSCFLIMNIILNKTTIESLEGKPGVKNHFSNSKYDNWCSVFGNNPLLWFFPCNNKIDEKDKICNTEGGKTIQQSRQSDT